MENKKHLYWVAGLVIITLMICSTLIWLNYNSWTLRFEMDDNTKEAIESIEFDKINEDYFLLELNCKNQTHTRRMNPNFDTWVSPCGIIKTKREQVI